MTEWTISTLKEHFEALRAADQRALQIKDEGDKEARRIKDESDKTALGLQRENQTYKDEKANNLREQIEKERGQYILRAEFKPIADWVATQTGRSQGSDKSWATVVSLIGIGIGVVGVLWGIFGR